MEISGCGEGVLVGDLLFASVEVVGEVFNQVDWEVRAEEFGLEGVKVDSVECFCEVKGSQKSAGCGFGLVETSCDVMRYVLECGDCRVEGFEAMLVGWRWSVRLDGGEK